MSRKAPQARARAREQKRRDAAPSVSLAETQTNIRFIAAILFIVLVVVYLGNLRLRAAGDSFATRVLPFSVLREGNFDLDEFTWDRTRRGRLPYYVRRRKGDDHTYASAPIATALLVTPLYFRARMDPLQLRDPVRRCARSFSNRSNGASQRRDGDGTVRHHPILDSLPSGDP